MKKINFNWGTGILITIIVFMIITLGTVFTFMNEKVDLVTDNYYKKELKYQKQIDKLNRTHDMRMDVDIQLSNNGIVLSFPDSISRGQISGNVFLYRPSDSRYDVKLPVQINENGQMIISTEKLIKGFWKVKVEWSVDSDSFFSENSLIIQ
ncbi:MAG TPA: FixH family protein [Ignavibacteriaceae bacterium]|nr:FixH family protein [Ignavibacteriaceae bacterium]